MRLQSFKELVVWQRSIELVTAIYQLTKLLPKKELYGLITQLRRLVVSIPSNIAEGYKQFLFIAISSAAELETQLIIMQNVYLLVSTKSAQQKLIEVQKMLTRLSQSLNPIPFTL